MANWGPLYIKPIPLKTTEPERRAGYEYAADNLHRINDPHKGNKWELFTTDPTDRTAPVYSIATPNSGGESSRFGTNEYVFALFSNEAAHELKSADNAITMCNYYRAHEQPEKADAESNAAREHRARSQEYRAAAQAIRAQWTR